MAETIKQADEVKYVADVSANVKLCLTNSKEKVQSTTEIFANKSMAPLHAALL